MDAERVAWIEAAKRLAANPRARVTCPRCQDEFLEVIDVSPPTDPSVIERHMHCRKCGAYDAMRLMRHE